MFLQTLGNLKLESAEEKCSPDTKDLCILSYLAIEEHKDMDQLRTFFFKKKHSSKKSDEEETNPVPTWRRDFRRKCGKVIGDWDTTRYQLDIRVDVKEFLDSFDDAEVEIAFQYVGEGEFLKGVECEECSEGFTAWLDIKRVFVKKRQEQTKKLWEAKKRVLREGVLEEDFREAADLANKVFQLDKDKLSNKILWLVYLFLQSRKHNVGREVGEKLRRRCKEGSFVVIDDEKVAREKLLQTLKEQKPALSSATSATYNFPMEVELDQERFSIEIPPCPYKGLSAFKEEDQADFFGREKFTEKLFKRVIENPFVALVGNSGSGKSSVVFAGLVPLLRKEDWVIISFRPRGNPFYEMIRALFDYFGDASDGVEAVKKIKGYVADFDNDRLSLLDMMVDVTGQADKPLLMVIDQFEELFTLTSNRDYQNNFLNQIIQVVRLGRTEFRLLLTMRSDFVPHALGFSKFGEVLEQAFCSLTAMTREELCRVIEEPAKRQGVSLQDGLVTTVLDDVFFDGGEEGILGRLPLLEFALTLLWEKQENLTLVHSAYEVIGKVKGALVLHAEQVFSKYTADEQERLRHIFTQLVRPGEGTDDTKQVSTKGRIGEQNWDLVVELASERLVTTDQDSSIKEETVEVIHEVLIRNWERLKEWVDTNREFIIWRNNLRRTIEDWGKENKDESMLLQGRRLEQAEEYLEKYKGQLEDAKEFIRLSSTKQKEAEKKQKRRQRNLIFAISVIAAVFAILAWVAGWLGVNARVAQKNAEEAKFDAENQREQAELNALEAKKQADLSLSRYLGFVARNRISRETTPESRMLLAIEATKVYPSPESYRDTLVPILQGVNPNISAYRIDNTFAFSPDEKTMVSSSFDGSLSFWDVVIGKVVKITERVHEGGVSRLKYISEADVDVLVTGGRDGTVAFWRGSTNELISEIQKAHEGRVGKIEYLAEIDVLVTGGSDGTVAFWRGTTGELIREAQKIYEDSVSSIEYIPEADVVAIRDWDGIVVFWQGSTGEVISEPQKIHEGGVEEFEYIPEVDVLVTGGEDGAVTFWQGPAIEVIRKVKEVHKGGVESIEYISEADVLVTGGSDGTVAFWRGSTGELISEAQKAHERGVKSFEYLPEADVLVTYDYDGTVAFWRGTTGELISEAYHVDGFKGISFEYLPKVDVLVTGGRDGTVAFWRGSTNELISEIQKAHEEIVWGIEYLAEIDVLVTYGYDGTVAFWQGTTGEVVSRTHKVHEYGVKEIEYIPESDLLVTGGGDGAIAFLQGTTGELIKKVEGVHERRTFRRDYESGVERVEYVPEIDVLVTGGEDGTIALWRGTTGELINEAQRVHDYRVRKIEYIPEIDMLVTGSSGKVFWNGTTGELISEIQKAYNGEVKNFEYLSKVDVLVIRDYDGTISFWRGSTRKVLSEVEKVHEYGLKEVEYIAEIDLLLANSWDGTVSLWQGTTGELISEIQKIHNFKVKSFEYLPEVDVLITGSWDGIVAFWRGTTGELIREVQKVHDLRIRSFEYLPEEDMLVTSGHAGTVAFWRGTTGELISKIQKPFEGRVGVVEYLSEIDVVAIGSWDGEVAFWQGTTGELVSEAQKVHEGGVRRIKYISEADILVTTDEKRVFWQGSTGELISEIQKAHDFRVKSFEYIPEADVLVTGGYDGTVALWQGRTGEVINEPQKIHEAEVSIIRYLSQVDTLITGSWNSTVVFWRGTTGELISEAQKVHENRVNLLEYLSEIDVVVMGVKMVHWLSGEAQQEK